MSTDAPKFPEGPNIGGNTARNNDASSPLKAQIIGVPNEARHSTKPVRITGQITRADDQGNLRVKTDSGTIELKLAKAEARSDQTLQKGQYVEIEIPPRRADAPDNNREVQIHARKNAAQRGNQKTDIGAPKDQVQRSAEANQVPKKQAPQARGSDYPQVKLPAAPVRLEPLPAELATRITAPVLERIEAKLEALPTQIVSVEAQSLQALLPPSQTRAPTQTQIQTQAETRGTPPIPAASVTIITTDVPPTPTPAQPQATVTAGSQEPEASANFQFTPKALAPILNARATLVPTLTPPQNLVLIVQAKAPALLNTAIPQIQPQGTDSINVKLNAPILEPSVSLSPTTQSALSVTKPNPGVKIQNQLAFRAIPASQHSFQPTSPVPAAPDIQALITDIKAPPIQIIPPNQAHSIIVGENVGADQNGTQIRAPSNIKAGEARATLSGVTPDKLPVISFPAGSAVQGIFGAVETASTQSFILHAPLTGVPAGAELNLQTQGLHVTNAPNINASAQSAPAAHHALSYGLPPLPAYFLSPEIWPVMNDALQTLQATSAQSAKVMSALTPSPGGSPANISSALLFFIAAVKGGDIQSWLGEKAVETLRKAGRGDILSRLSSEGSTLSRMAREAPQGEWRGLSIPFMAEQNIQKVAFYYKHDYPDDDGDGNEGDKRTRFIFDLSLSQMGMVQLDGMHQGQRLDMALRTAEPFSQGARMAMKQLYIQSLEGSDLHGELSFHSRPEQWVKVPLKDEGATVSI